MADNGYVVPPRCFLFEKEASTLRGWNSESVEKIGGHCHHDDALRRSVCSEVPIAGVDISCQIREGSGLLSPSIKHATWQGVPPFYVLPKRYMYIHKPL